MSQDMVTLQMPASLYNDLRLLAAEEQTDPIDMINRLVHTALHHSEPQPDDPILELIGAYQSRQPLIDNIAVSEDPELYLIAESLGTAAAGLHAWEIAPERYQ